MAHIVGNTGHVVTMDVEAELVTQAQEHLTAGGFAQVTVVQGMAPLAIHLVRRMIASS